MAWAYTKYLTDRQLRGMERLAQREHAGLWADAHPIPPWAWRKTKSSSKACAARSWSCIAKENKPT